VPSLSRLPLIPDPLLPLATNSATAGLLIGADL
jgi:hypothetical protein